MASEPINIPIRTQYDDEGAKDALADAEKIDALEPVVKVEVDTDTGDAKSDIGEVEGIAQDLVDRNPWIAEVLADTADAKADIESFQQKLKETGPIADSASDQVSGAAHKTGGALGDMRGEADNSKSVLANMVGNSAQDIGELGGVAGTAGMAIGQLGEYATEGNISLSGLAKVAGPMAGLAVATWAVQKGAKQAAEATKRLGESIKGLSTASDEAALASVTTMMLDQFVAGKSLAGIWERIGENQEGARRLVDLMSAAGATKEELKGLTDVIAENDRQAQQAKETTDKYGKAVVVAGDESATAAGKVAELAAQQGVAAQKADDAAAAFDRMKSALDMERTIEDLQTDVTTAMNNIALGIPPTKEEIRTIEDTIMEVGQTADANPIEVQNTLDAIDNGDLFTVLNTAQGWVDDHALEVNIKVGNDVLAEVREGIRQAQAGMPKLTLGAATSARSVGAQTVNVHLPRGARHGDIARAMGLSTRRNGRRYGNPSGTVQYARR